jgi:hypothetical protein
MDFGKELFPAADVSTGNEMKLHVILGTRSS